MDEKETVKQEEPENFSLLDKAKANAERLEKAAAEAKAQADRLEKLQAEQLLSGSAGIRPNMPVEMSEEEKKKQYALKFWKGTQIEEAIKKNG